MKNRPTMEAPKKSTKSEDIDWTKYPPGKLFEKVEPLLRRMPA